MEQCEHLDAIEIKECSKCLIKICDWCSGTDTLCMKCMCGGVPNSKILCPNPCKYECNVCEQEYCDNCIFTCGLCNSLVCSYCSRVCDKCNGTRYCLGKYPVDSQYCEWIHKHKI